MGERPATFSPPKEQRDKGAQHTRADGKVTPSTHGAQLSNRTWARVAKVARGLGSLVEPTEGEGHTPPARKIKQGQ
jgi:hypothetical protein